jgi:hypothetical protein
MVRVGEDINGKIIKRDYCEFNDFGDIRACTDFDTKSPSREMKDANGNWQEV